MDRPVENLLFPSATADSAVSATSSARTASNASSLSSPGLLGTSTKVHTSTNRRRRSTEPGKVSPRGKRPGGRRASGGELGAGELGFCVLGSGSGGNSSLLQIGGGAGGGSGGGRGRGGKNLLIDAGFGPRTISKRLGQIKVQLSQLDGIFVTHLDQDHFRPTWVRAALKWKIKIYVHQWHLKEFSRLKGYVDLCRASLVRDFDSGPFEPWPDSEADLEADSQTGSQTRSQTESQTNSGVRVSTVRLPHDTKGTTGYRFDTPHGAVGVATDLGHVPRQLIECFAGVDLLAIESNYDPQMQIGSSRPAFLKQRVMGGRGHLSNQQAFEAVQRIAELCPSGNPQHVVLLHRSSQCNDPAIVKQTFEKDARFARRVVLTQQRRRTRLIRIKPLQALHREQMRLAF